ncbi:MAG: ribosome biogenesis GTPase Der [Bacillota bacterium]
MDGRAVVAVIGRPNVGKSTLFNRLVGGRVAIVQPEPGVTRDRIYREAEWNGRLFVLVDTGGVADQATDVMQTAIRRQVQQALQEADVVLFMVDAQSGVLPEDEAVADILRRSGKPVLLVVNKVDRFDQPPAMGDYYRLGMGEPIPVSATQGLNTGDLLDELVANLPMKSPTAEKTAVHVAIIGRPNVGKSSLVNAILGEERVIVTDVPGTTRDSTDTPFKFGERNYILIDTAGIRRKGKIDLPVERYSVIRAQKSVARAEVAVIVIDAEEGVTAQDKRIAGMAEELGRAVVIAINKWDLVPEDKKDKALYRANLKEDLDFISYAPSVFTTATTGQGVVELFEAVNKAFINAHRRIPSNELNALLEEALLRNPPPPVKGKRLDVDYVTQVGENPPVFLFYVNNPGLVHFSYRRYLENQVRTAYNFTGTPVRFAFKRRRKPDKN